MYGFTGKYDAQQLANWTSEWGGGSLPQASHGSADIFPGVASTPLVANIIPGGPGDTFYFLQRMAAQNAASQVTYHIAYQFLNDADLALCQALEFEIQRNDGQRILNGGVQFDFADTKKVRTYDFIAGHWVATPLACDPNWLKGGSILDVVCIYDLTQSLIAWRGLQINGVWNPLGITRPAKLEAQNPYLNYAFQYDCTGQARINTLLMPSIDITVT